MFNSKFETSNLKGIFMGRRATFVLLIFIILGIFLRSYEFRRWMHFQADQYRDIEKAQAVLDNGLASLPLLGPKASGTGTHLGPIYYYLQTVSLFLFPSHRPQAIAYPDLFFSVAFIWLFYYFLRCFFDRRISLSISLLVACAYVLIQYSRFPWNPNSISFWGTLLMLSLYKVSTKENKRRAGWWLVLSFLSYGIVSQLHFIAFFGFPLVVAIFWVRYFPKKIAKVFWLMGAGLLLLVYSPVLINELNTGGENSEKIIEAINSNANYGTKSFFEVILKESEMFGKFFFLTLSSLNDNELKYANEIGFLFIVVSLSILFFWINKRDITYKEKTFLNLIFAWFLGFFILYYPLIYKLNQFRFWLAICPLPFIFLGIILKVMLGFEKKKIAKIFLIILVLSLLVLNLTAIEKWYASLNERAEQSRTFRIWSSSSLHQKDLITLGETEEVGGYFNQWFISSKKPICFYAPPKIGSAIVYLANINYPKLEIERLPRFDKIDTGALDAYLKKECSFFWITEKNDKDDEIIEKLPTGFSLKDRKETGVLSIWEITK